MNNSLPPAVRRADMQAANKLRQLPSHRYGPLRVPAKVLQIIHERLLPILALKGRNLPRKVHLLEEVVANVAKADKVGACVAIPRDGSLAANRLLNSILDKLVNDGFLIVRKGSQQSGLVSRYALSAKGLRLLKGAKVLSPEFFPPAPTSVKKPTNLDEFPVVLRNADKTAVAFKLTPDIQKLVERIIAINERNLVSRFRYERAIPDPDPDPDGPPSPATLVIDAPNVWVRAIYNGDFEHGGRLYAYGDDCYSYSLMKKEARRTMTIDGEPIAEFDFSGHHPRILYHLSGVEVSGDVYRPLSVIPKMICRGLEKEARTLVKRAVNAALNARDQRAAMAGMSLFLKKNPAYVPVMRQLKITVKGLMERVIAVHPKLPFFTGAGLKIQAAHEQPLLLDILEKIQSCGYPALGLHDGVICRANKQEMQVTYAAMQEAYVERFNHYPLILRDH